jgi:uncharacterized DUF497 family protein
VKYEWDAANLTKHGIDFEDAIAIFDGPVLEKVDKRIDYGEERFAAVGIAHGLELFVVYTWRGRNRRLISARRASRDERKPYYQAVTGASEKG